MYQQLALLQYEVAKLTKQRDELVAVLEDYGYEDSYCKCCGCLRGKAHEDFCDIGSALFKAREKQ